MEDVQLVSQHNFEVVGANKTAIKYCRVCGLSYFLQVDSYTGMCSWVSIPHKDVYGMHDKNKALERCQE